MKRHMLAAALLAAFAAPLYAQDAADLEKQGTAAYLAKDFARAARLYQEAFAKDGSAPGMLYNAACAEALSGQRDAAFASLRAALRHGYAKARQTEADSDFASLRDDPRWPALLADLRAHEQREARLWDAAVWSSGWAENISEDDKIAGLSRFWSEVKYNFVFTDKLKDLDWDRLYLDTLPKVRATRSTTEYYRVLMELCARLQDGHTNVYPPVEVRNQLAARPAFRARLVEGRVFVAESHDPEDRAAGIVPGVEVTHIDGQPALDWLRREVAPIAAVSTPQDLMARMLGSLFLAGSPAVAPRVSFVDAQGRAFTRTVKRHDEATLDKLRPPAPPFEFRMLPGNVAYVALNSFGNARAADGYMAAFPEIAKADALIIDVRANGGGNSSEGNRVLATLVREPLELGKWSTRNYQPTYRAWGRNMPELVQPSGSVRPDAQKHFDKPVAVLISPGTYSAAEDFSAAFDMSKRGTLVGETTGGSTGQPLFFRLPGGGQGRVVTKHDVYRDGRVWVGKGIAPQVEAKQTLADLRAGRDSVLEAALRVVTKK